MQHDPMEVESQIAELILGMPGRSNEDKLAAILDRFPDATDDQMVVGASIAVDILDAAATEYQNQADAIAQEIKRRGGSNDTAS